MTSATEAGAASPGTSRGNRVSATADRKHWYVFAAAIATMVLVMALVMDRNPVAYDGITEFEPHERYLLVGVCALVVAGMSYWMVKFIGGPNAGRNTMLILVIQAAVASALVPLLLADPAARPDFLRF